MQQPAFCFLLSVTCYLILAVCYLLSNTFNLKLVITYKLLFPFAQTYVGHISGISRLHLRYSLVYLEYTLLISHVYLRYFSDISQSYIKYISSKNLVYLMYIHPRLILGISQAYISLLLYLSSRLEKCDIMAWEDNQCGGELVGWEKLKWKQNQPNWNWMFDWA